MALNLCKGSDSYDLAPEVKNRQRTEGYMKVWWSDISSLEQSTKSTRH